MLSEQIHTWRDWEEEARRDHYDCYGGKMPDGSLVSGLK